MAASISKQISLTIYYKTSSPGLISGKLKEKCIGQCKMQSQRQFMEHGEYFPYMKSSNDLYNISSCQPLLTDHPSFLHRPAWRSFVPTGRPLHVPSRAVIINVRDSSRSVTSGKQDCWQCGKTITEVPYFCASCGVVQSPIKNQSYFQTLGVAESFDVDTKELTEKYRDLQRVLHPDKYSQKSQTEKEYSVDHSTLVNKAYSTLLKPLSRGLYLLRLREEDLEKQLDMNPEFLGEIMELNEALLEAETREDVERLGEKNQKTLDGLVARVSLAFRDGDLSGAKELLLRVKYFDNFNEKCKERITWFNDKA